jgi:hypothetical protein
MSHAAEGSLQAYLDGEIDAAAAAQLVDHLAVCPACTHELAALQRGSELAHNALALLDTPPQLIRVRAALAAERRAPRRFARLGASSLAKAAMLLLALAGAGAAAIPGSPVRRALEATFARVAQLFTGDEARPVDIAEPPAPAADPAMPGRDVASISIAPADNAVRVMLHAPAGPVDVTVRLADRSRANVVATTVESGVRFVSATGRLEVVGLGTGEVVIEIPRTLEHASIQVGGQVHVYKQASQLHLSGPAGTGQGSEVRFRIGN